MKKLKYLAIKKVDRIPKTAGVYSFWNKKELLYIGKATNLKDRVKTHFHSAFASSLSLRASARQTAFRDTLFIHKVTRIGYIETQSEIDALLLESKLIKKYQPKYNVMWKDGKQYFYVGITKENLPRVVLTHQPERTSPSATPPGRASLCRAHPKGSHMATSVARPPKTTQVVLGPFVDGKAIKEVLRLLRRVFPYYTKKHGAKLCPWCHLGLCPGPFPNKEEYKKNIGSLIAVLEGKRFSVFKNLKKEMEQASKEQNFERAAKLRDRFFALEKIVSHNQDAQKILQKIFRAKKEIVRIEAYDISNMQGKEATGSMVTFLNGEPAKNWYRKFKIHISGKSNDFAMMEETISRRLNHPEWPYPDLMIIDGGKGQLSSALKAISNFSNLAKPSYPQLGLAKFAKIYVAAIAKKHNELFLPNRKKPILLKNLPQSVQNLILHIRDEAHRFAIAYHKKLRQKKFLQK